MTTPTDIGRGYCLKCGQPQDRFKRLGKGLVQCMSCMALYNVSFTGELIENDPFYERRANSASYEEVNGVKYLHGLGCKKGGESCFECSLPRCTYHA